MQFAIELSPEAVDDLHRLRANVRAVVKDALEKYLRHEPMKLSKSRIKRLRGLARPQFRLRVDDVRVFYDVTAGVVEILGIVDKQDVDDWLNQVGVKHEEEDKNEGSPPKRG